MGVTIIRRAHPQALPEPESVVVPARSEPRIKRAWLINANATALRKRAHKMRMHKAQPISREEERAMIAARIASHGVQRCETVFVMPSQAARG